MFFSGSDWLFKALLIFAVRRAPGGKGSYRANGGLVFLMIISTGGLHRDWLFNIKNRF